MATTRKEKFIVGVDGSAASIEALRQAQRIASALGAGLEAWACWELPTAHEENDETRVQGLKHQTAAALQEAMWRAFGPDLPRNVRPRVVRGAARQALVDGSRFASLLVVGRRGHGGFTGLLMGSVSSACVAHAHCPVLVVHPPGPPGSIQRRSGTSRAATQET